MGILDKAVSWVKDQGKTRQTKSGGVWKWVLGIMVTGISMLTMGLMYYRMWKQGKKLAKLLHEKDVSKQTEIRGKILSFVDRNREETKLRHKEADAAKLRIVEIDSELEKVRNEKFTTRNEIDVLRNWDDIDNYLADHPSVR